MTRQERIQIEIIGELLKAAGIDFKVEAGRHKHRMLVARGRRISLAGSPAYDDCQLRKYARSNGRRFVQSILQHPAA